jgi:hypothetical protein
VTREYGPRVEEAEKVGVVQDDMGRVGSLRYRIEDARRLVYGFGSDRLAHG